MYMSLGGLDVSRLPWDFIEPFRTSWLHNWKSLMKVHGHFPHFYFCPVAFAVHAVYFILSVNNRRLRQNKQCSKMCWFMNKFQWNCSLLFWDAMSEKLIFQCVLFMVGWNTSFPQSAIDWSRPINKYK